jgi:2-polyprenyl-6-hydroxyphenyl methylase/3-demethylubiquinone-9 3-methyltransferase
MPSESLKTPTLDPQEVEKFSAQAQKWWDGEGSFKVLHRFNPVRLQIIREQILTHFNKKADGEKPFAGLSMVDVGCGGGLLCEPLARLGADVTGLDPSEETIKTALAHAGQSNLSIDYRVGTVEDMAEQDQRFDVVLCLEVIEHVKDVDLFLASCCQMVHPGGLLFVATINKTLKALGLAVIGAEYVLGWLPKGTHDYRKFMTPRQVQDSINAHGIEMLDLSGIVYQPFTGQWKRSTDTDVNYMITGVKALSSDASL